MKSSKRRKGGIVSWLKSIADLLSHYYTLSTRYRCFPLEFISSVHSVIQILFPVPSKAYQPTVCTTISPCVDRREYLSAESRWMEGKSQREQKFQTSNAHSIRSRSSGDTGMMGMRSKYSIFPYFFMLFSANCRAQTFPQSHNVNRWVALCGVESKITFLSHLFFVGEFTSHEIVFCIT